MNETFKDTKPLSPVTTQIQENVLVFESKKGGESKMNETFKDTKPLSPVTIQIQKNILVSESKKGGESKVNETFKDTKTNNKNANKKIAKEIENIPNLRVIKLFLNMEGGINFNTPKYSGIEANYYKTNNTEISKLSYQFDCNMLLKNKLIVGSGIGLNKFENNYTYNTTNISYITTDFIDSVYVLDAYVYDVTGLIIIDSMYFYDYFLQTVTDTVVSTIKNEGVTNVNYITIPLNIGYLLSYKKFLIGVEANIRSSFLQKTSGGYYSNNTFTDFNTSTNPLFKSIYFDVALKLGIHYNIWDQLYLNGSVKYMPTLSSIYKVKSVDKKIQTQSVSFGISYLF